MSDLVEAMARAMHAANEWNGSWHTEASVYRDQYLKAASDSVAALRTVRPDVAALLDGDRLHTPAEVAALVEAARREEREACAEIVDDHRIREVNDIIRAIRARGAA